MSKQHEAKLFGPAAFHHFEATRNEGGIGIDFQYGVMGDESRTLQAIQFDARPSYRMPPFFYACAADLPPPSLLAGAMIVHYGGNPSVCRSPPSKLEWHGVKR